MFLQIRELKPEDIDHVLLLWEQQVDASAPVDEDDASDLPPSKPIRCSPDAQAIRDWRMLNPGLSLVLHDGPTVYGVILASRDGEDGFVHRLLIDGTVRSYQTEKMLVDKALMKLEAAGVRRCHLRLTDEAQKSRAFWDAARWPDDPRPKPSSDAANTESSCESSPEMSTDVQSAA